MLRVVGGLGAALALPVLYLHYRRRSERVQAERAQHNVEARLGGIVESAMDAIITIGAGQRIVQFNAAAERAFLWPRDAVIGQPIDVLIPQRFRQAHQVHLESFGQTATTSRSMSNQTVLYGLRANGEEFPIEATISQIVEDGQRYSTVILRDVTERTRAEEALKRSLGEIEEMALTASTAREQEKSRLARELHDELGQGLTMLKLDVAWLREHAPDGNEEILRKLSEIQLQLDGTVAAARRISDDLRPLMLDDLGLTAAAEWLVDNFTNRTGIPCELKLGAGDLDLPDPHATAVFRVLQECLTNVAKHAEARQVEATLDRTPDQIVLTVSDNGLGFEPADPRSPGSHGLMGVKERAFLLGGEVRIESTPGKGTLIEMTLPASRIKAPS